MNCEYGQVVRGASADELRRNVEAHVVERHPELVGKISPEDMLAMAEEA